MRVTLLHGRFTQAGGAERYALELAVACADAGHTVTVLSTTPPPPGPWQAVPLPTPRPAALAEHPAALGKAYRHLADVWPWRAAVAQRVLAGRPDVVHLHNWQHVGAGAVRAVAARVPVLHTVHDFALVDPSTTLQSEQWSAARRVLARARARVLLAQLRGVRLHWPSERTRELAAALVPEVRRAPADVVPLSARSSADLGSLPAGDPRTFLFLGHLSAHKGLPDVLAAWATAPAGSRLLIAGDGPLRAQVEALAAAEKGVEFLGYVDADAKREALRRAGWLLFPSTWHENFSISCVEALAAGRPIVPSAVARPPMAGDGSVVVVDRPADLAAAVRACADLTPPEYAARAASARQAGHRLGWDAHVAAMLDLLTSTAGAGRHVRTG